MCSLIPQAAIILRETSGCSPWLPSAPLARGASMGRGMAQPTPASPHRGAWDTGSPANMLGPATALAVPLTHTLSLPLTSSHRCHKGPEDALCVCGHKDRREPFPGDHSIQLCSRHLPGPRQHHPVRLHAAGEMGTPSSAGCGVGLVSPTASALAQSLSAPLRPPRGAGGAGSPPTSRCNNMLLP